MVSWFCVRQKTISKEWQKSLTGTTLGLGLGLHRTTSIFGNNTKMIPAFISKVTACYTAQRIAPNSMNIEDIQNAHSAGYHHQTLSLRTIRRCMNFSAFKEV